LGEDEKEGPQITKKGRGRLGSLRKAGRDVPPKCQLDHQKNDHPWGKRKNARWKGASFFIKKGWELAMSGGTLNNPVEKGVLTRNKNHSTSESKYRCERDHGL